MTARAGVTGAPPAVGETAPDFRLPDQHGEHVVLSELSADRAALLVFYPFAFSGICTGEMADIVVRLPDLQNERVQVLGISCDPKYTLRAWAEAERLEFPLLSDFWPHGEVSQAYGVFQPDRGMPVRGTFLVGLGGVLRWSLVHGSGQARDFDAVRTAVAELV